ncbi:MAG: ADP-forming succinate--CoA ligase subunit beta [Candidatus Hinthialibacter antarcticus]|nr:ADP-forming succinate--CoA ligase subunit beta [Candidatus Hinthialibacter antarcticus]
MKIHEYQAKEILRKFNVPVPRGFVADNPSQIVGFAKELGSDVVVVKAQIHAGGRGKGGGVKLAKSPDEAKKLAGEILGMNLVTHQTGPEGKEVLKVLVEEGLPIKQELYIGVVIDRASESVVVMASNEGGVEIEEVAEKSPEKILKAFIDPSVGLTGYQARALAFGIGLNGKEALSCAAFLMKLYKAFEATDASLAEINPLVVTEDGRIIALDAKVNFDDNALYRHPDFVELRDVSEEDPLEVEASKHDLNYIKLDGEVGCMVNGAGLAMATMDLVKLAGSMPANFLDVGGTASVERVAAAFRILMSDQNVKAVLINIFGGIVRCDRVAGGVIEAMKQVEVNVPVVIRLRGTNSEEARKMLEESDFNFLVADGLAEVADKVVEALKG